MGRDDDVRSIVNPSLCHQAVTMGLAAPRIRPPADIGRLPVGKTASDHLWWFAAAVIGALVALEAAWLALGIIAGEPTWTLGMDQRYYADVGARWLADGTFYLPHQLSGPYHVTLLTAPGTGDTLYPPNALLLFVPFAVLPAVLWWAIPIAVTGYALYRLRPESWAWVVMLVLLAWPRAIGAYLFGNTDIWMVAAIAAGAVWGWPALAVTLKPTLAPFALLGVRRRSWWLCAALGVGFVALTWPLWMDYLTAMRNVRGLGLEYSLGSLPLMLIPVVAWVARR